MLELGAPLSTMAPIWFEIWGALDPGKKKLILLGKFQFLQAISPKNFDFSLQIFEKFQFFPAISQKKLIFPQKISHLQLILGKLFYFSFPVQDNIQ